MKHNGDTKISVALASLTASIRIAVPVGGGTLTNNFSHILYFKLYLNQPRQPIKA